MLYTITLRVSLTRQMSRKIQLQQNKYLCLLLGAVCHATWEILNRYVRLWGLQKSPSPTCFLPITARCTAQLCWCYYYYFESFYWGAKADTAEVVLFHLEIEMTTCRFEGSSKVCTTELRMSCLSPTPAAPP